jgi:hypothetical protein
MNEDAYRTIGAVTGLIAGLVLMVVLGWGGMIPGALFGAGGSVAGGICGEKLYARRH